MAAAKGRGPAPPELELAWLCGNNHLPKPGGMLEQDYRLMNHMRTLSNVHEAVKMSKAAVGKEIHSLPSSVKRIMKWLKDRELA